MVPRHLLPGLRDPRAAFGALSLAAGAGLALAGCASSGFDREPPPLVGMEEPLALVQEPDDEAERLELPAGAFSGVYVRDARPSLEAMLGEPEGVLVARVVENSPGAAAGLVAGDLLFEVEPAGAALVELAWPKDWRALELAGAAGDAWQVRYDRAGVEREARLVLVERLRPAARAAGERVREERRVGVVLRAATEVESRALGRGPGAGAVVVGLSLDSPWRAAGVGFEDLILAVDGVEVGHPTAVVDAIRAADEGGELELEVWRDGARLDLRAPVSRRATELKHLSIPLIYSFERDRDSSETSVLIGLLRVRRSPAAWDVRLLWLISFSGGDADRLIEVDS